MVRLASITSLLLVLLVGCTSSRKDAIPPRYPGQYTPSPAREVNGATVYSGTITSPNSLQEVRAWYRERMPNYPGLYEEPTISRAMTVFTNGNFDSPEVERMVPVDPTRPAIFIHLLSGSLGTVVTLAWSEPKK